MLRSLRKTLVLTVLLVFSFLLQPNTALAFISFDGQFTATNACEAVVSIKKGTNPGNVRLKLGETYQTVGKNKDIPSHYLLQISQANPPQRWVEASCLNIASLPVDTTPNPTPDTPIIPIPVGEDYLLAISWQPAFCESKPDKEECKRLAKNPSRPEATNFTLHGLWPQPEDNVYCGVSRNDRALDGDPKINNGNDRDWSKLPAVEKELSPETWQKLQAVMPGTLSNLHRHEWIKHGTCYQATPEEYFSESIVLLQAFNQSPVQQLFANSIGRQLAVREIDKSLSSFGAKTGDKVEVKCDKSLRIGELWVNLNGEITPDTPVSQLLVNSPNAEPEKPTKSCLVDDARD
ncbi:ribonuclease T2 family protein [Aliinostoc sp. HNIBRCY26]|uniref:ribonuclease T2 family protein n=1 Tax=Aliinostoc sp. HNIBRCY26 TaxID=3418997 RepID=UPI003CFC4936